ncbi:MAG: outer membrane protein assembly factor BamD [Thermodesulfovibrionia bacterium]
MLQRANIKTIIIVSISALLIIACSSKKETIKDIPFGQIDSLFKKADEMMKKGDLEEARKLLERVKAEDTSQEFAPIAQLRIADTYFQEERYEDAEVEYQAFLDRYAYHGYAPYAQYRLGMTYFKRIETVDISYSMAKKALETFESLLIQYPRNPYIEATEQRIKACRNVLAEYELYVGKFYFKKGSYMASAWRFEELIKRYPDSTSEAEALYYLAISYKNLHEYEKAINALNTLIEKFPRTKLSKEARDMLASLNNKR